MTIHIITAERDCEQTRPVVNKPRGRLFLPLVGPRSVYLAVSGTINEKGPIFLSRKLGNPALHGDVKLEPQMVLLVVL